MKKISKFPKFFLKKQLTHDLTCGTIILTCGKGLSFCALFSLFKPQKKGTLQMQGGSRYPRRSRAGYQ